MIRCTWLGKTSCLSISSMTLARSSSAHTGISNQHHIHQHLIEWSASCCTQEHQKSRLGLWPIWGAGTFCLSFPSRPSSDALRCKSWPCSGLCFGNFQTELDLRTMRKFVTNAWSCYYAGGSCSVCHGEPLGWLGGPWRQLVGQARKWYGWQDILKKILKIGSNEVKWSYLSCLYMYVFDFSMLSLS